MSHTVLRGEPNASQLYLDGVLNEILQTKDVEASPANRAQICLAEILYHCFKKRPNDLFMINGATSERVTNEQLLRRTVSVARAMNLKGLRGKMILLVTRNHQRMLAVYYAALFAGSVPFMIDPEITAYELTHFLKLSEPSAVFCDREHFSNVNESKNSIPGFEPEVFISDEDQLLDEFVAGCSDDLDDFEVCVTLPEATIMLLPTSGSTGLPKAALLSNKGLVMHLPSTWTYHSQFPKPTELMMVLTTMQWMTFTLHATCAPVYQVPLLMSPKQSTIEHTIYMLEKFRPTWTFFGPAFAKPLVVVVSAQQLSSLKTLILLGSPSTKDLMNALKVKLPNECHLCDGYGATEAQGFITLPDRETDVSSLGRPLNVYKYKIVDENEVDLEPGSTGELFLRGDTMIKGYYKDTEAFRDTFTEDGWYKTGDVFHLDRDGRLYYNHRRKFNFKYLSCHVSPEEVESVIYRLPEVQECVVVGTDNNGGAAAVMVYPGREVSKDQIHKLVNSNLSHHKRLHGGIVFVNSLPHTLSGKIHRNESKKLIQKLVDSGECC